jgi:putative protease
MLYFPVFVEEVLHAANDQSHAPELLAPAGDWDALKAAVANGANAVYFGLENFNARHRAENFKVDELPGIVRHLHDHNVRGFLTFNTLIFSDELPDAVQYIRAIAESGVDAVIVQDLGLAKLIHTMAPTLRIHGSTQMTLTEPRGIEFVRSLGVERVVLARELSIHDIRKIAQATPMPLEVFIHGALCVAYSGQCLTSEALGGRSANRGQCAQACRLPYELIVDGEAKDLGDKAYLLSPQDLSAHDLVGELSKIGVASLKIEGRLKSAHYVAATTQTYRQAIESAISNLRFQISDQQRGDLQQTFSRGFTHGFLGGVNHQQLVSARFPKSRGTRIGTVVQTTRSGIVVTLDRPNSDAGRKETRAAGNATRGRPDPLKPGDGVVFDEGHPEQDEQGGRIFAVHPRGENRTEIELGRGDVNLHAISPGAIVWKTDDPAIRKRLEHSFARDVVANRVPVCVSVRAHVGEKLSIQFNDVEVESDKPLETARKFPIDEATLREQLGRLGDTPFELGELITYIAGEPMVPKSVLNDLRRRAVEKLIASRNARSAHAIVEPGALEHLRSLASSEFAKQQPPSIYAMVRTLDQLDALLAWEHELRPSMVYCDFEDVRGYKLAVERAGAAKMPIGLATLRIIKPGEEGLLRQILDCAPDALLVRNLAAVSFYREAAPHLPQIGDYSLNIANELTAKVFADTGLVRMVPSYDLNWNQLRAMLGRFSPQAFEVVVHQHMPMFHMEHCVFAHTLSDGKDYRDCGRPCDRHQLDLKDRVGRPHPLIPDVGCRNTVYNAQAQSAASYIPRMRELGLAHFRVEMLREKPHEVAPLMSRYADVLLGKTDARATIRLLHVLEQLGVTSGTLDQVQRLR